MTKLTLETCYGRYEVEVAEDDHNIGDLWDAVIKPCLLAAGYGEATVNDLVPVAPRYDRLDVDEDMGFDDCSCDDNDESLCACEACKCSRAGYHLG